ncbi:MAG TPA: thiol-disulfide oxidoreductase DCC family protein [Chitinophagaceae bacterium]
MDQSKPIIFFDGVCNLCNSSVQFVIKRDKESRFRFASLQSEAGKELLDRFKIPQNDFNSFILLEDDKTYSRSDAALKVWSKLEGWKWTRIFFAVPAFIRNGVYNIIARNRYRWFGKREECMVPSEELKSRFLD